MDSGKPVWTSELLAAPHQAPDKANRVRRMFNGIAPRYRLVNALFSVGRDGAWRREAVRQAGVGPEDEVLDVACGTGDLARAFLAAGARRVVGADFAHQMLRRAAATGAALWCEADALNLPFRDERFSIVSCAFGVRNFADLEAGYREMHRVLRPGGRAVVLEFSRPRNRLARTIYETYTNRLMPMAATLVSGDTSGAYRYLPKSIASFPDAEQMRGVFARAGFSSVKASGLDLGIVTVYVAVKT